MRPFLVVFVSCIYVFKVFGQINMHFEKSILNNRDKYFIYLNRNGSLIISSINKNEEIIKSDTVWIHPVPEHPLLSECPLLWDVVDSFLVQVVMFSDGSGLVLTQILRYNINNISIIINKNDNLLPYLHSKETMIDNAGLPVDRYISRIHYREDTLIGPLYFDFCAYKDTFLVFSYLGDNRAIEV